MKAHILTIAGLALLLAGCEDAFMKWTHETYFHVTSIEVSGLSESTLISITTQRVAIVSDCARQSTHDNSPRRISGSHYTATGQEIPWVFETADAQTISRIKIDETNYQLADGNTFLISSKGGKIRILQLQFADNKILNLADLCRSSVDASNFFSQSQAAGQKQNVEISQP